MSHFWYFPAGQIVMDAVKEGAVLKNCRLVDEAPTFAAALGFTMEGTDGRVLHEILK